MRTIELPGHGALRAEQLPMGLWCHEDGINSVTDVGTIQHARKQAVRQLTEDLLPLLQGLSSSEHYESSMRALREHHGTMSLKE